MVQLGIWFSRSWLQHPSGTTRVVSTCLVTTLSAQGCSRIWKTHFRHFASQVASCTWWQCKSVQKPGKVRPEMLDTWIVDVCWCNVLLRHYTYIYMISTPSTLSAEFLCLKCTRYSEIQWKLPSWNEETCITMCFPVFPIATHAATGCGSHRQTRKLRCFFRMATLFSKVTPKSCLRGLPACHRDQCSTYSIDVVSKCSYGHSSCFSCLVLALCLCSHQEFSIFFCFSPPARWWSLDFNKGATPPSLSHSLLPSFSPTLLFSFPASSFFLLLPPARRHCGHQWTRAISQALYIYVRIYSMSDTSVYMSECQKNARNFVRIICQGRHHSKQGNSLCCWDCWR